MSDGIPIFIGQEALSANSAPQRQLAPTCIIDPDGIVIAVAPLNEEHLLVAEIEIDEPGFGRRGRIEHSMALMNGGSLLQSDR